MKRIKVNKIKAKQVAIDLVFLVAACCMGAFSTVGVLLPNGLTTGGLTGIVRIVQQAIPLNFSVLYYGCSAVILIAVAVFLGLREVRKILLLTILYPAVLLVFEWMDFHLLEEKDVILAAIFCGVFSGICNGTVFWRGYSFSGTDAIAKIIRKKICPQYGLSKILLVIDGCVIIVSAFIFGRNIALYALVTQVIITRMVDIVIYGFETKIVKLQIITNEESTICQYIMEELERGVSRTVIRGEYTKTDRAQLDCLCSPRESILIRRKVAELDAQALVTVQSVEAVWGAGSGFTDLDQE